MFNRKAKKLLFTRRAFMLGGIKACLLSALVGRLYYLQIIKEEEYKNSSDNNRIRLSLIPPLRGKILDRDGRHLAVNRNYYRVLLDPLVKSDIEQTITKLSNLLELSEAETVSLVKKAKGYSSHRPLMLYEHLTWKQLASVEVNSPDLPGISINVGQMRYFPMEERSPHIIGYLGAVPEAEIKHNPLLNHPDFKIGISGIEQSFDAMLRGKPGVKQIEVNAFGAPVGELSEEKGIPGEDLYLTIDKRLQLFVNERLDQQSASVVVMDVDNGNVLALASTPGFDPNQFTYGISVNDWKILLEHDQHPLVNKVLSNQYPPGSTFKPIVALAGLAAGVDPQQTVFCPGYLTLGTRRFHCWKKEGHGSVGMQDAIKGSCNVYFYTIAKRIGIQNIEEMAKLLGLGQIHDVGVSEQKEGRVPSKSWKQARFKQSWQLGDTLNTGIGQGYTLVTPLQLAVVASRLASGKRIEPRLTSINLQGERLSTNFESLGISEEYMAIIREGMRRVVNVQGGSAYASRIIEDQFMMAGKTGTAQVVSRRLEAKDLAAMPEEQRRKVQNHALFVGFAPFHAPRYAISVVVEHGGSAAVAAAPVARDILRQVQLLNKDNNNGTS